MRPRFFPSLPNQNRPPRTQQRVGSGGMTEWKGANDSASVRIGSNNSGQGNYLSLIHI